MNALILDKPAPRSDLRTRLQTLIPPGRLGQYILLIAALGTGLLGTALTQIPHWPLETLGVLYVVIFLTELAPIKLDGTPLQGSCLSVSAAVAFAALLVLGPAGSIVVNTGSALAYCVKQPRPFYKRLLTSAALVCSSGSAGGAYLLAGGQFPLKPVEASLEAAGVAAIVYLLANSMLISGAISLQTRRPFHSVLASWQWLFLELLTTLAIGLFMAFALTSQFGFGGLLLVGLGLLLPWYSTYFYVQKNRQVAEQNEQLKMKNAELATANRALDLHLEELHALHTIGLSMNSVRDLATILQEILAAVVRLIHADTSAIFLYDGTGPTPTIAGHIGLSADYVQAAEMALNGSALRALHEGHLVVMDRDTYMPAMLSRAAAAEGIQTAACLPLKVDGELVGGLDVCFKSEHAFGDDELGLLKTLAEQAAVAIQNEQLVEKIYESYLGTIRALAATVEAKDPYTRGHSEVVRQLAVATGTQLGLTPRQLQLLTIGALFHDIGKIGISESILNKPGALDEAEWPVMRQHPIIGERILRQVPALDSVPTIVRHHHERFDRQGYPDGICAQDDLLAAIISVCDAYQAMTSNRPYRQAYAPDTALKEIRQGAGTQFVPQVVDAFVAAVENKSLDQFKTYRFDPALLLRRV